MQLIPVAPPARRQNLDLLPFPLPLQLPSKDVLVVRLSDTASQLKRPTLRQNVILVCELGQKKKFQFFLSFMFHETSFKFFRFLMI